METLKWLGNLKGVEGRAGRRGLAGPAGLCMTHFFLQSPVFFPPPPPSSASVALQPSPCLAIPPRAKKSFSVRSASRSKETGLSAAQNVSPSCIVTLQRKKGRGGLLFLFLEVLLFLFSCCGYCIKFRVVNVIYEGISTALSRSG